MLIERGIDIHHHDVSWPGQLLPKKSKHDQHLLVSEPYVLTNTRLNCSTSTVYRIHESVGWPISPKRRKQFLNGLRISIQLCRQHRPPFLFCLGCGLWECRKFTKAEVPSCCLSLPTSKPMMGLIVGAFKHVMNCPSRCWTPPCWSYCSGVGAFVGEWCRWERCMMMCVYRKKSGIFEKM